MSGRREKPSIENALNRAGMKSTSPRRAILRSLEGECRPMSAQELHEAMRADDGCDLVTVYRTLDAFEKAGIVRRCDFSDGVVRYECVDASGEHHHHLICGSCKKVTPLEGEACALDVFERDIARRGYVSVRHSLEFFGTCPDCQKNAG